MESSLSEEHASYRHFFLFGFVVLLVGGGLDSVEWEKVARRSPRSGTVLDRALGHLRSLCISPRPSLPSTKTLSAARGRHRKLSS